LDTRILRPELFSRKWKRAPKGVLRSVGGEKLTTRLEKRGPALSLRERRKSQRRHAFRGRGVLSSKEREKKYRR